MVDFQVRTDIPRPLPPGGFWTDVAKIALGIFFGSVLTSIFCGILGFISWQVILSSLPKPPKPGVVTVEEVNDMIRDYKAMTANPDARELQKAEAARAVAVAFSTRNDRKAAAEWLDKVRRHEAASTAGKKTGPVK